MAEPTLSAPVLWGLLIGAGLGTWVLRGTFILSAGIWSVPWWLGRALRYVPAAVLAALVTPAILGADTMFTPAWSWHQPVAGLMAGIVAAITRRVVLTLLVGMAALWTFNALT